MRFTKGHGTSNDFVVLPDLEDVLELSDAQVAAICDRRRGVGGDGILRLLPTAKMPGYADLAAEAAWFMDYRNADGSDAEMCGNGVRVVARYLEREGLTKTTDLRIATRDGIKDVRLLDDGQVSVDMGLPREVEELPDGGVTLSMGNPHVVLFADDLASAPVETVGRTLDLEWIGGTNVEFVHVEDSHHIAMRVWERGVGETQSCGTGACAAAVGAHLRAGAQRSVAVDVPGGRLHVTWRDDDHVELTGPAVLVADGEIVDRWLAEAGEKQ